MRTWPTTVTFTFVNLSHLFFHGFTNFYAGLPIRVSAQWLKLLAGHQSYVLAGQSS